MKISFIARIVVGITLAVVWFGLVPLYGMPFGGCEKAGYSTFTLGCSSWPEFLRGVGSALLFFLIVPRHYILNIILAVLFALGVCLIGTYHFGPITDVQTSKDIGDFLSSSMPFVVGSMVSLVIVCGINLYTKQGNVKNA